MWEQLLEMIMNVKEQKWRGGKCYDRCVLECLLERHGFQLNGLASSWGLEGPVEVKVHAG